MHKKFVVKLTPKTFCLPTRGGRYKRRCFLEKRNVFDVEKGRKDLLFIVTYVINFRLEFLSNGSTKWLEIWYSCYILPNSEKIFMRKVKIIACKAHVQKRPRIPILNPSYVINFQLKILCNGLMYELQTWHEHCILTALKHLLLEF